MRFNSIQEIRPYVANYLVARLKRDPDTILDCIDWTKNEFDYFVLPTTLSIHSLNYMHAHKTLSFPLTITYYSNYKQLVENLPKEYNTYLYGTWRVAHWALNTPETVYPPVQESFHQRLIKTLACSAQTNFNPHQLNNIICELIKTPEITTQQYRSSIAPLIELALLQRSDTTSDLEIFTIAPDLKTTIRNDILSNQSQAIYQDYQAISIAFTPRSSPLTEPRSDLAPYPRQTPHRPLSDDTSSEGSHSPPSHFEPNPESLQHHHTPRASWSIPHSPYHSTHTSRTRTPVSSGGGQDD